MEGSLCNPGCSNSQDQSHKTDWNHHPQTVEVELNSPSFPLTPAMRIGDNCLSIFSTTEIVYRLFRILKYIWKDSLASVTVLEGQAFPSIENGGYVCFTVCVSVCVFFFVIETQSEKEFSTQSAVMQCSISPQFSTDSQNKLPVIQCILSTCSTVDLPVSRPRLIDSWVKASDTWLTPYDYCSHGFCLPVCRPPSCSDNK